MPVVAGESQPGLGASQGSKCCLAFVLTYLYLVSAYPVLPIATLHLATQEDMPGLRSSHPVSESCFFSCASPGSDWTAFVCTPYQAGSTSILVTFPQVHHVPFHRFMWFFFPDSLFKSHLPISSYSYSTSLFTSHCLIKIFMWPLGAFTHTLPPSCFWLKVGKCVLPGEMCRCAVAFRLDRPSS